MEIGESVKTFILFAANAVTNDYSPGLISSFIFLLMIFVAVRIFSISHQRQHALQTLRKRIVALRSKEDFQQDFEAISDEMNTKKGKPNKQLAFAFSEFGETLIQPKQMGEGVVLNGIRPSVFINLEDLGFSLSGWRFWPGVFVSVGLLMTFLGLIAVLNNTQGLLPDGAVDPQQTIYALKQLLSRASAKFIMSLTGLFCSILLTLLIRRQTRNLNGSGEELNRAIEEKVVFVSLESLATRQLEAIEAQSAEMKLLNSELIAKLSRPLENMADNSMKAVGTMVNDLSSALTEGIGTSLASLGESIDSSAKSMTAVSSALSGAAEQFDRNLTNGIDRLQTIVEQLGTVSGQLAEAANMVSETAGPVLETVKENNTASRKSPKVPSS
nr:hypothetical protein [Marinicella sp. W31]MDC2877020.1 hypothetical protein [Marinicella sp. W31]